MPTKAFDSFTGPPDQDITGRKTDGVVPGGSACPELQAGYWERVINSPSSGGMDIQEGHAMRGRGIQRAGNNAATVPVELPPCEAGDSLVILAYSTNGSARSPQAPTGFVEQKRVSNGANGEIALFWKEADGSESMTTINLNFTGLGATNVVEATIAMAFYGGAGAVSIGAISVGDFWLTNQSLGPVTGLTPGAASSVVLLCAGKNTDFTAGGSDDSAVTQVPSTPGWTPAFAREVTFGNKSSWCCFYKYQNDGTPIADTTITDPGSPAHSAPGVGFMIELIIPNLPTTGELRHRCSSGPEGDWNHYVLRTDPTSPLDINENYMVEAEFVIYDQNALWAALLARHDKVYEIGWEYNMQVFNDGSWFAQIYRVDEDAVPGGVGNYITLDSDFGPVGDLPYGVPFRLKMCVEGGPGEENVRCYTNDSLLFDVTDPNTAHYDTWPGDALPLWPGLCLADTSAGGTGSAIVVNWWRVADLCDDPMPTPCDGCEGGPENPWPWDPPPVPPPDPYFFLRERLKWRAVPVPTTEAPGSPHLHKNLKYRTAVNLFIRKNLKHRQAVGKYDSDQLPPTNDPFPPFYDPCNLLTEVPPGDVTVLPITGRYFGMAGANVNICGPLFTGTKYATGNWTPGDLAKAAAKGVMLIGSQGGYQQYMPSGHWVKEDFLSVTLDKVSPLLTTLQSYSPATYVGYSCIDDFESKTLWPPYGVPISDLIWVIGQLHAMLPGIRIGVRGRPRQFPTNPGVDFYLCQYVSWRGESAAAFGAAEYARALAWNSYVSLDLNYLHGGNGSSGIRHANGTMLGQSGHNFVCSGAEVQSYISDMVNAALAIDGTAAKVLGSAGYMYDPDYVALPGIINGLAAASNAIAALPPP